jgi:hypothetical protein
MRNMRRHRRPLVESIFLVALTCPVQRAAVLPLCCLCLFSLCCAAALAGPLPSSITQLRNLEVLSVESNELSGTVPPNMCTDMMALRVRALLSPLAALPSNCCCCVDVVHVQSANRSIPLS